MHKMTKVNPGLIILLILTTLLSSATHAARVGVVIEYPEDNGIYKTCVGAYSGDNAYEILERVNQDMEWSYFGPALGHSLCSIKGFGCPATNCFCNQTHFWNFYIRTEDDSTWTLSDLGFDSGSDCNSHYCASDGDVIGLAFGPVGTMPPAYSFGKVCPSRDEEEGQEYDLDITPSEIFTGDIITFTVLDDDTDEGIEGVEIRLWNAKNVKVIDEETDDEGKCIFSLSEAGIYKANINVKGYEPPQTNLEIEVLQGANGTVTTTQENETSATQETTTTLEETSTTSATSTSLETTTSVETTTTTTTTSTSTTSTTTTTPTTTTTSTLPVFTTSTLEDPKAVGMATRYSAVNTILTTILILVIVALAGYYGFNRYKKGAEKPVRKRKSLQTLRRE